MARLLISSPSSYNRNQNHFPFHLPHHTHLSHSLLDVACTNETARFCARGQIGWPLLAFDQSHYQRALCLLAWTDVPTERGINTTLALPRLAFWDGFSLSKGAGGSLRPSVFLESRLEPDPRLTISTVISNPGQCVSDDIAYTGAISPCAPYFFSNRLPWEK